MSVMYSYAIILFTLTIYKRIKIPIIKTNKKQCLKRSKSEICLENDDIDLNINKKKSYKSFILCFKHKHHYHYYIIQHTMCKYV